MRPELKKRPNPRKKRSDRSGLTKAMLEIAAASKTGIGYHAMLEKLVAYDLYPDETVVHVMFNNLMGRGYFTVNDHHRCDACFKHAKHYNITEEGRLKIHDMTAQVDGSIVDNEEDEEPGIES